MMRTMAADVMGRQLVASPPGLGPWALERGEGMGRQERVLVLFNEPVLPESHPESTSEVEILENVDASAEALRQAGYEPVRLGIARDPTPLLEAIRDSRPDVVLNLFEGCGDYPLSEV